MLGLLSLTARPTGCACNVDANCATGLVCNGRTCQALRKRGEFCVRDTDCGSDATGAMVCLPSKNWCGPLAVGSFCDDFNLDCLSGICSLGKCSTGKAVSQVRRQNCKAGLVCNTVAGTCGAKLADGQPCLRNVECQNQCNSFSGTCKLERWEPFAPLPIPTVTAVRVWLRRLWRRRQDLPDRWICT